MFRKPALFLSSGKEAHNLVDPLDQAILSLGTKETVNLRYAPANKSTPNVIAGNWLLKN
jgi:hypothetical protein